MRPIKFRAWDKKNKKWLFGYEYPNLGGFSLTGECVLFGEFSALFRSLDRLKEIEITQYTGLKDKNGREIYEGDVVKSKFGESGEIIYDEGEYGFKYKDGWIPLWDISMEDLEAIGNIYENKELLK